MSTSFREKTDKKVCGVNRYDPIEEKEKAPRRQFSNLAGYGAGARRAEAEKSAKFGRRSAAPPAFSPAVEAD